MSLKLGWNANLILSQEFSLCSPNMQRALQRCSKLLPILSGSHGPVLNVESILISTGGASNRGFASGDLRKTPLHGLHIDNGGKMVDFQGWDMPVQYKDSIMASTKHCREHASLFDVAHMRGVTVKGPQAIDFVEHVTVGDFQGLRNGTGTLSLITNDQGGIVDDTVTTRVQDDDVYMVLNAGCAEKDLEHMERQDEVFKAKYKKEHGSEPKYERIPHWDRSLLALQGPAAHEALRTLVPSSFNLDKFYFGQFATTSLKGIPAWVTRVGYTGEDGFEISVPNNKAVELAQLMLEIDGVQLAGLGARDSLRLEAGLCLYGHDIKDDINPIEAGLLWTIGKRRREKWDFVGGDVLQKLHADKSHTHRRVGFLGQKGAPAREGAEIQTPDGKKIGTVTSGAFSPCLGKNIGMGYVEKGHGKAGTELRAVVRGKTNTIETAKMPFVEAKYFKP